ncbi:RHS repeat-associated core domain-containing protein [Pseudomonas sp. ABFPK]|uniref:RHS repeat-associated core domain-containing protein n=1 Tax=Pseudomonas sp. ABFPK TaxID=1636605 RepID=UPI000AAE1B5B|nr:RHS repeat-associated core domain-containing protein [Pseudomonas sp. ABFPK]
MTPQEKKEIEEREIALVPLNNLVAQDIAQGEATVNAWLLELSGNTIDLATVKAWAGAVPVVGNIVALFDALGDIIHLVKTGSNDPLDWVSLGINLIGVVPVPPTMAAARMTLRPVLFLARQQLKKNKGDFAQAVMNIMVGHLSATLMGEIETFVERAETELPGILNNAANTGFQTLNSLADAIERIAKGEIDTTQQRKAIINSAKAIYAPIEEPSLWDLLTRAEAVISATAGAVQYGATEGYKAAAGNTGWVLKLVQPHTNVLRGLAQLIRQMLTALANPATQNSIAWLLAQLNAGLRKRKPARRVSANTPAHGSGVAKDKGTESRVEATRNEARPKNDPRCDLNGTCPGTSKSISYARGTETLVHVDFNLPGVFPVAWARTYRSSLDAYDDSEFGARWITPFSMRFDVVDEGVLYHADDGRTHSYALPKVGKPHYDPVEKTVLIRVDENHLSLAHGHQRQEHYQRVGDHFRLVGIIRRGGARIALHYEHQHAGKAVLSDLVTYQDEDQHQHVHTQLDEHGRIKALWLMRDGRQTRQLASYDHDDQGDLRAARDEHGAQWTYQYQHHLVTRYTDRTGRGTSLEWQGEGPDAKAVREWADDGSFDTRLKWNKHIRLTTVTDALGQETRHYYDYLGYTYRIIYPDSNEEWLFRDDAKNVIQHVHTDGSIDRYVYDERSNLLQHTRPDGSAVHHAYDDLDQRFKTRDAEGGLWKYDYDQRGNIIETLDPLENKTQYTYNSDNLPISIIDANGGEKKLGYTRDGQLASYTDCSGKTTLWKYDGLGQLSKAINAAGETTEYQYQAGQLTRLVYPDKTQDRFEHDAEGRLLSYTDALNRRTAWAYNEAGLIRQRHNPDDSTLTYHWNKLGQLLRLRNENNSEASFKYDPAGRLIMETGFDKQVTDYLYDQSSNQPTRRIDGDRITRFEYDAMGRLVKSHAGQRGGKEWESETFAYDGNGNLLLAENEACKLQWFYDLAGNNTREHQHFKYMKEAKVAVFKHEYDALNLRIATTRPDGHRVSWLTYGSGHLLSLKLDEHELLSYQRDDLHREIGREQGNGLVQRQTWTPNGQLQQQTLARRGATRRIAVRDYEYDLSGQLTRVDDLNRGDTYYRYDPVGRLLEAGDFDKKELFAFDPASNLLDPQAPPGPNPHSPRRINDNVLRSYCGTQYRYDERGNLAERTTGSKKGHFDWDLYNRLRRYEDDRLIVTFAYDALGRRLYKHSRAKYRDRPQAGPVWNQNARRQRDEELGCGYTWYVWEGDTLAFECRDREGKGHTTHYVFEPGTFVPVAQAVSNHVVELLRQPVYVFPYDIDKDPVWLHKPMPKAFDAMAWYQCDQLGTPMELTGEDGEIAWSGRYKAWGLAEEQRSDEAKWAEIRNPLRFQGQYWDVETGLHYNRYRYYDPQVGRFVGMDPIGAAGGINFYSYVTNPTGWIDPYGLTKKSLPTKTPVHRIGGNSIDNLRLKEAEKNLLPPGISVLHSCCPCAASKQMREAFPKASGLQRAAGRVASGTTDAIREAGFDVIGDPTQKFPNHARIIHPDGVNGFSDGNLEQLASALGETTKCP